MKVIIDIWTGPLSQTHVARFIRDVPDALALAEQELATGALVNLRIDHAWGGFAEFDERRTMTQ